MIARYLAISLLCVARISAQQPDFRWEKALPAGSAVSLHNISGNVSVTPSTSGKVEVVGIKHGDKRDFEDITLEVVESSHGIAVCAVYKRADMDCDDRGIHGHHHWGGDRDWDDLRIDMEVKLPKDMRLDAHSVSGNVSVVGGEGDLRAGSVSGDVRLERLHASSVKASTVSGDVRVQVESLTGNGPLTFSSVSGNVTAELPKNIDADVRMRSVSGNLDSDFPLTLNGRMSRHGVEARIGKGGRDLEVHTVSGDVRLRAAK